MSWATKSFTPPWEPGSSLERKGQTKAARVCLGTSLTWSGQRAMAAPRPEADMPLPGRSRTVGGVYVRFSSNDARAVESATGGRFRALQFGAATSLPSGRLGQVNAAGSPYAAPTSAIRSLSDNSGQRRILARDGLSAYDCQFNRSMQHPLILPDAEVRIWRGMHGRVSCRSRRLSQERQRLDATVFPGEQISSVSLRRT